MRSVLFKYLSRPGKGPDVGISLAYQATERYSVWVRAERAKGKVGGGEVGETGGPDEAGERDLDFILRPPSFSFSPGHFPRHRSYRIPAKPLTFPKLYNQGCSCLQILDHAVPSA